MTQEPAGGAALTLLAGRYRLEELLAERDGSSLWKATDQALARAVTVCTFDPESHRAEAAITAARAAGRLSDPRLAQIFDADDRDGVWYLVSEWPGGERLDQIIAAGPVEYRQAAEIIAAVAGAVAAGHAAGLAHLCLTPDLVWRDSWGEVKLGGLGTAAALAGAQADDPALADTRGLARLLYATLTGYWPGPEPTGLPAAPHAGARPVRPGQVRSGIPSDIDAVTCRALFGDDSDYGPPILNPAGLEVALSAIAHPSPDTAPLSSLAGQTQPFAPVQAATRPLPAIPDSPWPPAGPPVSAAAPSDAPRPPALTPPAQAPPAQAPPAQAPPAQAPPAPASAAQAPPPPELSRDPAAPSGELAGPSSELPGLVGVDQPAPGAPGPTRQPPAAPAGPSVLTRSASRARASLNDGQERARALLGAGSARAKVTAVRAGRRLTAGRPGWPAALTGRARTGLAVLALAGCVVTGWAVGHEASQPGRPAAQGAGSPAGRHGLAAATLRPVSATTFDPYGDGQGSQLAGLAIDASPATAWHTAWYTTAGFGNLKPGTGLLINMGHRVRISAARISLGHTTGADFQLRVGSAATSLSRLRAVADATGAGGQVHLRVTAPVLARYVLIWFTKLPPDASGTYEANIYNIRFQGTS